MKYVYFGGRCDVTRHIISNLNSIAENKNLKINELLESLLKLYSINVFIIAFFPYSADTLQCRCF